jgi:hypothetical protein
MVEAVAVVALLTVVQQITLVAYPQEMLMVVKQATVAMVETQLQYATL